MAKIQISDGNDLTYQLKINEDGSANVSLLGGNASEPFNGSSDTTHTFTKPMNSFVISNDGTNDLAFTIGTDTYTVKGGEVFDERFASFTQVTISSTVPFRAYGRY